MQVASVAAGLPVSVRAGRGTAVVSIDEEWL